ncbi:MAG: type II toxin-antitoxin system PrlF family antitoxin [Parvularcula sp.]|nr:type II toxin-antitoxin system PrlF family antitoxin [Parvularcula sp.]
MIRSTLTTQGQTTIPAPVRKALGVKPKQALLYEIREDEVVVRAEKSSLMDLVGCLGDGGRSEPITDEEIRHSLQVELPAYLARKHLPET